MKRRLLVLIIAAVTTWNANAEDFCKPGEDRKACKDRFIAAWKTRPQEEVAGANTGVSNLVSPAQSTSKDFLSMLAAALLVPMNGDGSMPLALDFNVPVVLGGQEQRIKLQTVLAKPQLSGELRQRLAGNAAALTAMNDSVSEFDDVTVSAALNPSTRGLGRSLVPHQAAYDKMLDTRFGETEAAVEDLAGGFALLLNNQPQLFGSVLYRTRRNVAGPDERSARLTYEMGFHNLNRFYRRNPDCAAPTDANAADCAKKVVRYAGADSVADDPANRLALSVEYKLSNALTVAIPEYSVNYRASDAHTFIYSLSYGRNFLMRNGRIDLAVNYEDTTVSEVTDLVPRAEAADAPVTVRDRFVASATYTYKINDNMAMPFSLIYANHAAFLGDVDRKLNAHFGISFKMPSPR